MDIKPLRHVLTSMAALEEWVGRHVSPAFDRPDGRLIAFEATFVQAKSDGVTRLDVGEDVWAITLFGASASGLTESLQHIHEKVAAEIEWLPQLGLSRHCRLADVERWLTPFLELGFYRTLDLYGDEFAQPIEVFKPLYRVAKDHGLRLKAHVGEWGRADDVWRAVEELGLDEVQHGIAAADSPKVMRFLADHGMQLNICPTSNVMLERVESLARHPIRKLYDAGVRVTINTDDVLVFGQSVTQEYLSLYEAGVFSPSELEQIRQIGLGEPAEARSFHH